RTSRVVKRRAMRSAGPHRRNGHFRQTTSMLSATTNVRPPNLVIRYAISGVEAPRSGCWRASSHCVQVIINVSAPATLLVNKDTASTPTNIDSSRHTICCHFPLISEFTERTRLQGEMWIESVLACDVVRPGG